MDAGNGDREWHEQMRLRMQALENARKELEDAFIVMTHVETRMSQLIKEEAEYVASHEARLRSQDGKVYDHEQMLRRIETGLAEATEKINFLIDRKMKREGSPEAR